MKPTLGRVPSWPLDGPRLFSHNGPITRTVADAALMLQLTSGRDLRDPMSLREGPALYYDRFPDLIQEGVKGLRVAWSPDLGFAQVDPEVHSITARAAKAFEELGCHLEEAKLELGNPFDWFDSLGMCDMYQDIGHLLDEHRDELFPGTVEELERSSR
jgi:aspartyl-tRNA(Asn)/glutamyl-tRNA(Gln) amidotransferase subunit A